MDQRTIDDGWRADVRAARMHLYCDHDALALRNVIHARESLLHDQGPRWPSLPHLASAQWLVQHHRYDEAHAALQAALDDG